MTASPVNFPAEILLRLGVAAIRQLLPEEIKLIHYRNEAENRRGGEKIVRYVPVLTPPSTSGPKSAHVKSSHWTIALIAPAAIRSISDVLSLGCDDFFELPICANEVAIKCIRAARPLTQGSNPLSVTAISFDHRSARVRAGWEYSDELTKKEIQVFHTIYGERSKSRLEARTTFAKKAGSNKESFDVHLHRLKLKLLKAHLEIVLDASGEYQVRLIG